MGRRCVPTSGAATSRLPRPFQLAAGAGQLTSVQPRADGQASTAEGSHSGDWPLVHPRDEAQFRAAEGQLVPSVGRHSAISLQPRADAHASTAEHSVSCGPVGLPPGPPPCRPCTVPNGSVPF
jgi:hypothetical protein